jgi:hypothetical protein
LCEGLLKKMKKEKKLDKARLTQSRKVNWRPLNEYASSTTMGQEKLTRPPGIQDPHRKKNEARGNENGVELHGVCAE